MGAWNGLSLRNEYAETLGDTSVTFKARVMKWMNDVQDDICSRHSWHFLVRKGLVTLSTTTQESNLYYTAPGAPAVTTAVGGALTTGSVYTVAITFYSTASGLESTMGTASATVTMGGSSLEIAVTAIPVSTDTNVTSRKVYLSKDSGSYFYIGTIADNTTTTYTIDSNATSTVEPPDYVGIKKLSGSPWLESQNRFLQELPEDDMRLNFAGTPRTGFPSYFAPKGEAQIVLDYIPSSAMTLRFNFFKLPDRMFPDQTRPLDMPIWLKNVHEAGVLWKGYQFRERPLAMSYKSLYESTLASAISERSNTFDGIMTVRNVVGDINGTVW